MGGERFSANLEKIFEPTFVEIRKLAKERWIGGDKDPERLS
jgi:hypothetical protein